MCILPLSELRIGIDATVAEVRPPVDARDQELVLRLIEIGFLPGEKLRVIARGHPGEEPIAVRLGSTTFALRRFEAAFIQVTPVEALAAQPAPGPTLPMPGKPCRNAGALPEQPAARPKAAALPADPPADRKARVPLGEAVSRRGAPVPDAQSGSPGREASPLGGRPPGGQRVPSSRELS